MRSDHKKVFKTSFVRPRNPGKKFDIFIMCSGLQSLPKDVVGLLLGKLPLRDAVRLSSTCGIARTAFSERDVVASLDRGTPKSVARFLVAHSERVKKIKSLGRSSSAAIAENIGNFVSVVHIHIGAAQIPDGIADEISGFGNLKTLYVRKLVPEHRSRKSGLSVFRTSWLDGPPNLAHVHLFFAGSYDEIIVDHSREFDTLFIDAPVGVCVEGTPPPPSASLSIRASEIDTRRGELALSPFTKLRTTAHARRNPLVDFERRSLGRVESLVYACQKFPWVQDLGEMTSLRRLTVEADTTLFRMHEFKRLGNLKTLTVRTKGCVYVDDPRDFGGFVKGETFVSARSSRNVDFSEEFYAPLGVI